jgi:hypothetical protein
MGKVGKTPSRAILNGVLLSFLDELPEQLAEKQDFSD